MLIIGIDPGVNTGFAVKSDERLIRVTSMKAVAAETALINMHAADPGLVVYVEDARKRTWFANAGREKLQGAGSVKRDCQRWQEFLVFHQIKFVLIHPANNKTKLTDEQFKKITKWGGRTNEHARDAAMLIWGR